MSEPSIQRKPFPCPSCGVDLSYHARVKYIPPKKRSWWWCLVSHKPREESEMLRVICDKCGYNGDISTYRNMNKEAVEAGQKEPIDEKWEK